jgi:uncharacterized membrane protein YkvA (DUF1232 family)
MWRDDRAPSWRTSPYHSVDADLRRRPLAGPREPPDDGRPISADQTLVYHPLVGLLSGIVVVLAGLTIGWVILVAVIWLHRPARALVGPAVRMVPDLVGLVRSLLGDRSTPPSVKLALVGLLAYLLSPIDLIPDFLPVVGSIDDLAVAAIVLRWAGRRVGAEGLRSHWSGSPEGFDLLRRLLGI